MNIRIIALVLDGAAALPAMAQTPIRPHFGNVSAAKFNSIPNFVLPDIYKGRTKYPLPKNADLTKSRFMPPCNGWSIQGWSCANATDFGGFEKGNAATGWMTGYDKYHKAMEVRVIEYYKIDASAAAGDELIKQYLVDHGDQSPEGGLLTFQINSSKMPATTVNGRRTFTSLGSGGGHALVICGFDEAHDGGSYMCVNNWGDGIYWAPTACSGLAAAWPAARALPSCSAA